MKSPLRRLRGFGHHYPRERKAHHPPPAKLDELADAAQDVEEMRNCYDCLLSAAAATTNSVYEFSEALEEMGSCLLTKTALNDDDDDSGRVLMMLGRAQFELTKSVDSYRTNIIHTITTPSESLLKELQTVEEMKQQCDMKRDAYEAMRSSYREKGQSRNPKTESFSTEQLQASFVEYQEDAALFIFRLKSLKQGQFHSLLTQAARHHASQLSFFRRGLKCLESLEPHVKAIAEKHHIDCQFVGLEDNESDNDGSSSYQDTCSDDGELSFDYEINDRDQALIGSRGSMDLDKEDFPEELGEWKKQAGITSPTPVKEIMQEEVKLLTKAETVAPQVKPEISTHSAPIFADHFLDQTERLRQLRPSSAKHSYKLPTPVDDNYPRSAVVHRSHHSAQFFESKPRAAANLWHSSPLEKASTVRLPSSSDFNKKLKREAWSGPIPGKAGSSKSLFQPDQSSSTGQHPHDMPAKSYGHARQSSSLSPKMSPLSTVSPKISELHELPRPPANVEPLRPSGLVGYSGPLVSKRQAPMAPARASPTASQTASPLPRPPAAFARSYSIPSNSQRIPIVTVNTLLLDARNSREGSEVSSPPLIPLSFADLSQRSTAKTTMGSTRRKETL
ncbi:uncharacterized protein At2g33490 [Brachypodium distachyon]|uniref:BAR domain-containing protein n=1 Tax=Brachypodium distachyon TaxID=15368 RepID=I1IA02_BRADI|nr:uncharacterized protein At2g33490 [Brachypodium distachyon]KQJ99620.1 hypothetical protein BRADI_3g44310v3 [Brachypodium distachyon]|eukprot:XP_010235467.1 uncharacterized protein At2g33490 [Brachypodium distachyon]